MMTFVSTTSHMFRILCIIFVCLSVLYYILTIYSYDCYGFCCHTSFFFSLSLVFLSIHLVKWWFTSPASSTSSLFVRWTINRLWICNVCMCMLESREKWNIYVMMRWKFQGKTELACFYYHKIETKQWTAQLVTHSFHTHNLFNT